MLFSNFLLTRPTVDQIHFFLYQKLRLDETFHMVPYMTLYLLKQKFCKVGVCFGEVLQNPRKALDNPTYVFDGVFGRFKAKID